MRTLEDRLPIDAFAGLVQDYFLTADARPWNRFTSIDWARIEPERLSADHRAALAFVTIIEDHIPGYFADYYRQFPLDETVPVDLYAWNREMYHFSTRWAQEEDAHAQVLFTYQVRAGLADPETLRRELAVEGQKLWTQPHPHPVQIFTYNLIQEKATQLYYQQLSQVIEEPVLKSILTHMAHDEARHFSFFANVLEATIRHLGEYVFPLIKTSLTTFKMPLARTVKNYWRLALRVADAAGGYDHTVAYGDLLRIINRAVDEPTLQTREIEEYVRNVRAV